MGGGGGGGGGLIEIGGGGLVTRGVFWYKMGFFGYIAGFFLYAPPRNFLFNLSIGVQKALQQGLAISGWLPPLSSHKPNIWLSLPCVYHSTVHMDHSNQVSTIEAAVAANKHDKKAWVSLVAPSGALRDHIWTRNAVFAAPSHQLCGYPLAARSLSTVQRLSVAWVAEKAYCIHLYIRPGSKERNTPRVFGK